MTTHCLHVWDRLVVTGISWAESPADVEQPHGTIDVEICRACGAVDYIHPHLGKTYLERP